MLFIHWKGEMISPVYETMEVVCKALLSCRGRLEHVKIYFVVIIIKTSFKLLTGIYTKITYQKTTFSFCQLICRVSVSLFFRHFLISDNLSVINRIIINIVNSYESYIKRPFPLLKITWHSFCLFENEKKIFEYFRLTYFDPGYPGATEKTDRTRLFGTDFANQNEPQLMYLTRK